MCLARDASATMALVEKLVSRGWTRRAAWEKAESWQRMTIWSERARRAQLERDARYVEMATDSAIPEMDRRPRPLDTGRNSR